MVPGFKLYFYPFLLCLLQNEKARLSDISLFIIKYFDLKESDLAEMTKQGKTSKHISRVNYCASYLKRLGLVENIRIGIYAITQKGKDILIEKGEKLTRDDLRVLPEYIEMQVNRKNDNMVFVEGHYNRIGKFIPGYWCDKKCLSEETLNNISSKRKD